MGKPAENYDVSTLPKWAQTRIERLERDKAALIRQCELTYETMQMTDEGVGFHVITPRSAIEYRRIPDCRGVVFNFHGLQVEIRERKDGGRGVIEFCFDTKDHKEQAVLLPRASNLIWIAKSPR